MNRTMATLLLKTALYTILIVLLTACVAPVDFVQYNAPSEHVSSDEGLPTYFEGSLILMGLANDIDELIDAPALNNPAADANFGLQRAEESPLSLEFTGIANLEIALVYHSSSYTSTRVLGAIYDYLLNQRDLDQFPLFADLHSVVGAPEVGGYGNSVGAHPYGSGSIQPTDSEGAMTAQWALSEEYGIGLYNGPQRIVEDSGAGIRVVVFDTSPFLDIGPEGSFEDLGITYSSTDPDGKAVEVRHPGGIRSLGVHPEAVPMASHGLFVVGLVHVVAPDADLRLVRVLDDYGNGDLYSLVTALVDEIGELDGSLGIINLSLGTELTQLDDETQEIIRDYCNNTVIQGIALDISSVLVPEQDFCDGPNQSFTLRTVMKIAQSQEVIVVAAAGNGSSVNQPQSPDYPARYGYGDVPVIGVAATSLERGRSCFSNQGIVAAPGGNGDVTDDCSPKIPDGACDNASEVCPYALLSLVRDEDGTNVYAYWSGTSFAAPLVSGLAAVVRGTGAAPDETIDAISRFACEPLSDSSYLGKGIVNVVNALTQMKGECPSP